MRMDRQKRQKMMSWHTLILLGAASLLAAPFACAGADSTPGALTPVPIERVIPEGMVSPTDPAAESVSPNSASDEAASTSASATTGGTSSNAKDKPDPAVPAPIQPAPDAGKDLTDAQQRDMDAQIAELRKSPDVLAECAGENRRQRSGAPVQPGKSNGTRLRPSSTPPALQARRQA